MASAKQLVLITGANGGIGFELARQLLADPNKHVLLGSRSADKGEAAVKTLKSQNPSGTVELLQIDVASDSSIEAAAKKVETKFGRLDALVNNAGIASSDGPLSKQMADIYRTNVIGPQIVGDAFVPLLKKSAMTARIVQVTSGLGSIATRIDIPHRYNSVDAIQYRATKAALNMVHANFVYKLRGDNIKQFSYCPGFTVSALGSGNIAANGAKPTSQGAAPIIKLLNGERDEDHGKFVHEDGVYPW